MPRYRFIVEYDGTPYHGWQRQDGFPSVQQSVEEALEAFTREKTTVFAAGRTDAGVHALGQVIHFDLSSQWRPEKLNEAANGLLKLAGHPIAVLDCKAVPDDFDARFSARRRHYLYRIVNRKANLTIDLNRAWHVKPELDIDAMNNAAKELLGRHDFTTFRSTDCQAKNPVRTLDRLQVVDAGGGDIHVETSSRAFLHNQVRSMVGTLKLVGQGKWSRTDVKEALLARDRKACGPVAPACALYFTRVDYD